jgi:hypothetical protein
MISPIVRAALAGGAFLASLSAQVDWRLLTPANTPPSRSGHAMAFDPITDRIVLFGGDGAAGRLNDTWLFDGTTWTQVFPATSPPVRAGHPMAFDPIRRRVVMFGGWSTGMLSDTWEWDGQNWVQLFPATTPVGRGSQPLVWSPVRSTCVMWGGFDGVSDLDDLWEWNGVDWRPILTTTRPTPRRASEMAYDPTTGGLVLFSGFLVADDTWTFDNNDWRLRTPATRPPARYDHSMATDVLRQRVVMFGGTSVSDTWEWTGSDWLQRTTPTVPMSRFDTWLVYDDLRARTVMFGLSRTAVDMWEYGTHAPATWSPFGSGCTGTNGRAPRLSSPGRPWLGESFVLLLDQMPAGTSVAQVFTGFSNAFWGSIPLPLALGSFGFAGCQLLVDPLVGLPVAPVGGAGSWTLPLPSQASLIGVRFYNQAIVLDPGANLAGATVSNGGGGVLGVR